MPGAPASRRWSSKGQGRPESCMIMGLWLPSNHAAARAARRAGRPFIVSTRGMLAPWSLAQSRWKKRFGWTLYQRRDLHSAALFHATAEQEAEDVRRVGLRQPVALIPNGVDLPGRYGTDRPKGEARQALFLSRIHPKKGLLNLVQAWAAVRPEGWELVLAGPDADGHGKRWNGPRARRALRTRSGSPVPSGRRQMGRLPPRRSVRPADLQRELRIVVAEAPRRGAARDYDARRTVAGARNPQLWLVDRDRRRAARAGARRGRGPFGCRA